jgi:hypothetical protein
MNAVDPSGLCTFDENGNPVENEDGVCVAGGSGGSVDVNGGEPDPVDPIPTFPVLTLAPIGSPSGPTNVSAYTFSVTGTGFPSKNGSQKSDGLDWTKIGSCLASSTANHYGLTAATGVSGLLTSRHCSGE